MARFCRAIGSVWGCEFLCKAGGGRPSTALKRDGGKLLFRPSIIDEKGGSAYSRLMGIWCAHDECFHPTDPP